jgi:hypothetical protein
MSIAHPATEDQAPSEMVLRVTRAIGKWLYEHPEDDYDPGGLARAAIAAMREPTPEMIEASNREWDGRMSARSAGVWQAMIAAALGERA